jgi:hypothetical protein
MATTAKIQSLGESLSQRKFEELLQMAAEYMRLKGCVSTSQNGGTMLGGRKADAA